MVKPLSLNVRRNGVFASPSITYMRRCLKQALLLHRQTPRRSYRLSLYLVGICEMRALNRRYRNQNKPTNVLSFAMEHDENLSEIWLGDMVICPKIIRLEALRFGMPIGMRWAHIMTHGLLHLLGYSHENTPQRQRMETLEKRIMRHLGYPNPYLVKRTHT